MGRRKRRWADVGLLSLKVAIEYDGKKHFTLEGRRRDEIRDAELKAMGWKIYHVNKFNWNFFLTNMKDIIEGRKKLPTGEEGAP